MQANYAETNYFDTWDERTTIGNAKHGTSVLWYRCETCRDRVRTAAISKAVVISRGDVFCPCCGSALIWERIQRDEAERRLTKYAERQKNPSKRSQKYPRLSNVLTSQERRGVFNEKSQRTGRANRAKKTKA